MTWKMPYCKLVGYVISFFLTGTHASEVGELSSEHAEGNYVYALYVPSLIFGKRTVLAKVS